MSLLDPEYEYGYRGTYLGTRSVLTIGAAYDYQPDVAYLNYIAKSDPIDYGGGQPTSSTSSPRRPGPSRAPRR